MAPTTCCVTIKLWAMPLVYPVLLGYMPPLVGDHVVVRYAPGGHVMTVVGMEPTPTI